MCIILVIQFEHTVFILKPHSGIPIYRQLGDQIRRMAASGQLPPGTELPSIRELAVLHAINPMTVTASSLRFMLLLMLVDPRRA